MFSGFFGAFGASLLSDLDFGGLSGKRLGSILGRSLGKSLDDSFEQDPQKNPRRFPSLENLRITGVDSQNGIPQIFGTVRVGGQVIWMSPVLDKIRNQTIISGGWGIFPEKPIASYRYSVSVAIALCEGQIDRVSNIYANGALLDMSQIVTRVYTGHREQEADPLIESFEGGEGNVPHFAGTAYIVLEDIPLELFGGRLPEFGFDVVRSNHFMEGLEAQVTALCLIPASGEFVYATTPIIRDGEFREVYENMTMSRTKSDFSVSIEQLQATYPNLQNVSLVVGWFFDHLDPRLLNIQAGVEILEKYTTPYIWQVAGMEREDARLLSHHNGHIAYGGTPADFAVRQGIIALANKGYSVTFYPFLFGDIEENNADDLPPYPWRGRIKPQGTQSQQEEGITHFFAEYRTMILHYAELCSDINDIHTGAVSVFVIGSELVGLTHHRIDGEYPAVAYLKELAEDVRSILGSEVKITYGADWTEYGVHKAPDGSLGFPLDTLWSDDNIDMIGLDWYAPLSDMRDGEGHLDAQDTQTDHDSDYLKSKIEGGEGYDWYYANETDRNTQNRRAITDGAYDKPWIYRVKDIRNWWKNLHYPRDSDGIEDTTPTDWIPQSKKIIFTELGCPAVDKGANSPNLFPDAKSSENALPPFSSGRRDDMIQRSLIKAYFDYWTEHNETSSLYDGDMVDINHLALWCVDARPFPIFPARSDKWQDAPAYFLGHWLMGRGNFSSLKHIFTELADKAGVELLFDNRADRVVDGFAIDSPMSFRDMLEDMAILYGLSLIHQGDSLYVTNKLYHENQYQDFHPKSIIKGTQNIIYNAPESLPNTLRLQYFSSDQDGDIETLSYVLSYCDNSIQESAMRIPLVGFGSDMMVLAGWCLYQLRREQVNIMVFDTLWQNNFYKIGDIISYDSKFYRIVSHNTKGHRISYQACLVGVDINPKTSLSIPKKSSFYASGVIEAEKYIINNVHYLALSYAYGQYHIERAIVDGAGQVGTFTTWKSVFPKQAGIGVTDTDFYNRPTGVVDTGHDIWIHFHKEFVLNNANNADILAGKNRLAIYNNVSDLWEIISFETAMLVDSSIFKYQLSHIRRGLNGTVTAQGSPVSTGAEIMILDDALVECDPPTGDIADYNYKIYPKSHPERYVVV